MQVEEIERMGLVEIIAHYENGTVSLYELERWGIVHLQETMDRMKLVDIICGGTISVGMGDITEEQFKTELLGSPQYKRFGEPR